MDQKVDDNLYSRQIGTFGFETMGKLSKLKVLIHGLRGSATEIAKNLILMGVSSVYLIDGEPVVASDLSTNFFITPESLGRPRAQASLPKLSELNPYVNVEAFNVITKDVLDNSNVVVCCSTSLSSIKILNKECRSRDIGFIAVDTFGSVVSVFVDLGSKFICKDVDGQDPKSAFISFISSEQDFTVQLLSEFTNPFEVGDYVVFKQVKGMDGIHALGPFKIKNTAKTSITVEGNNTQLNPYLSGGVVCQVKVPRHIDFKDYEESIFEPSKDGLVCIDMNKFGVPEQLHWIIQAAKHVELNEQLTPENVLREARRLNNEAKARNCCSAVEEIDLKLVDKVVRSWYYLLAPVCSFVGGVVAHEVVKYTGKYHPIVQWLYSDFSLEYVEGFESNLGYQSDNRYAGQLAEYGERISERIKNARVFIVGSGALGCEFLKIFALMGVATGDKGRIHITDNDRIEVSNISRQFFFRHHHVGEPKSSIAAVGASNFNNQLKIIAYETRVCPESEDVFNDDFWNNIDIVVNALDNVKARQYVDGRCLWFEKPLLESGTLGTMGNTQVIVPHKTQSYTDSQDPPEASVPLCTLKHFPYQVEHIIEWSRDLFYTQFTFAAKEISKVSLEDSSNLDNLGIGQLWRLYELVRIKAESSTSSLTHIVGIAVHLFNELYYQDISQLLYSFPPDHKTSEGADFWSPPKKLPQAIEYTSENNDYVQFILNTSMLLANVLKIDSTGLNYEFVKDVTSKVGRPEFKPKRLKIQTTNDSSLKIESTVTSDEVMERECLIKKILDLSPWNLSLESLEFEKDDDSNHHIDFIYYATIIRCRNYGIEECDRHKAKMISGKIIPAIATTTSMIAGLVALEFIKVLNYQERPIEHFRNAYCNLAIPSWLLTEPLPPKKVTDVDYDPVIGGPVRTFPKNFTSWDKIVIDIEDKTLHGLVEYMKNSLKLNIQVLSTGSTCIFNSFVPAHSKKLSKNLTSLITQVNTAAKNLVLEASCVDHDQVDVVIPSIKYII